MHRREFLTTLGASSIVMSHIAGHGLAQGTMAPPTAAPAAGAHDVNPFLTGGFTPVRDELVAENLAVKGEIPREMAGVFMRNGPNPAYDPLSYAYPFDGDGMIHALYFDQGRVAYRNRFVMTKRLTIERKVGRAVYGSMTRPAKVDLALVGPEGDPNRDRSLGNLANINVIQHGGKYLALWEAGMPHEITRELETVGPYDFAGQVKDAMTAHPKFDPATGEMLMFHYALRPPYLTYRVVDRNGAVSVSKPIDAPAAFMVHDFAVTANHVAFVLAPVIFDFEALKKGGPFLTWQPQRGTKIAVLRRDGQGDTQWMDAETFFVFHMMNAHEKDGGIVIDYVEHEAFGRGPTGRKPSLWRLTLDLKASSAKRSQIDDRSSEFPRVDPRRVGIANRYGWLPVAGSGEQPTGTFSAIARYDFQTGDVGVHDFGAGYEVDEPVMIARPGSNAEGDGWLMTYLYDRRNDSSRCVILDPIDITRKPIAEIAMPRRVPHGLHGNWMPA